MPMMRWTARLKLKSLRGLMGLCGFLGDLPCWMPQGAVIGGKGANCDCAPWGRTLRKKPDGGNTELL